MEQFHTPPKYIERGEVSKHLDEPGRKKNETYEEYKERRKIEDLTLKIYMRGTPIDGEVKEEYINVTQTN